MKITVAKDKSGDFESIRAAVNSIETDDGAEIFIKNGFYFEKIVLDKPNVTFIGEDMEKTVIVYNDCALRLDEKGEPLGTFVTATFDVTEKAVNTRIENLTIQNSAGYGKIVGQAVALSAGGDKSVFKRLRLLARQDTLMLPPVIFEAMEKPDYYVRQYFEDCYIEGDVDFIFGGAAAVFKNCDIFCKYRPVGYNCFITAACTPENVPYGLVFFDCRIDGECERNTAYLGRPWLPSARTVFINTTAAEGVLNPEIWSRWGKTRLHDAACYAQNSFTDKEKVAAWTDIYNDEQVKEFTLEKIFNGWIPQ